MRLITSSAINLVFSPGSLIGLAVVSLDLALPTRYKRPGDGGFLTLLFT